MFRRILWVCACLAIGLPLGALLPDLVRPRPVPPITDQLKNRSQATAPAKKIQSHPEASLAPAAAPMAPAYASIRQQTQARLRDWIEQAWGNEIARDWAPLSSRTNRFLIDRADPGHPENSRWITETAVRVPCEWVDRFLEMQEDPQFGLPRLCKRWMQAAAKAMQRHGITGRTPGELLDQLGADRSARVLLVYAGWERVDPESPPTTESNPPSSRSTPVRLVETRFARLYPQSTFADERNQARRAILRRMKLGPWAETPERP